MALSWVKSETSQHCEIYIPELLNISQAGEGFQNLTDFSVENHLKNKGAIKELLTYDNVKQDQRYI